MNLKKYFGINKAIQILLYFLFIANASASLWAPFIGVFIVRSIVGGTLATAGFAIAIYSITKSVIQIPLARIIDRQKGEKDDFYVMMAGSVLGVMFIFGLLFVKYAWQLYLLEIVSGAADACLMAAYYGIFSRHVDKGSEGYEWSLFSVFGLTISTAVGGAIGGVMTDAYGFANTFIVSGVVYTAGAALLFFLYPYLDGVRKKRLPPFSVQ